MKTTHFFMVALAAIGMSACNTEEVDVLPVDNAIHVATEVGNATSRSGMTTADLTSFGMYITPTATDNDYSYDNYEWRLNNGTWTSYKYAEESGVYTSATSLMLWKNQGSEVNVVAYAPFQQVLFNTPFANSEASIDVTDQTDLKKIDYLYAQSKVIPSGTQTTTNDIYYDADANVKALHVKLHHCMAKLEINVSLGTEFNEANSGNATVTNPISEISVYGTFARAMWKLSDNTLTLANSTAKVQIENLLKAYTKGVGTTSDATTLTGANVGYECYLVPQTVPDGTFTIGLTVNGKQYAWTYKDSDNSLTFEGGKVYKMNLCVGKDMVTAGTWSVSDWATGGESNIETD